MFSVFNTSKVLPTASSSPDTPSNTLPPQPEDEEVKELSISLEETASPPSPTVSLPSTVSPSPDILPVTLPPYSKDENEDEEESPASLQTTTSSSPATLSLPNAFRLILHVKHSRQTHRTLGRSDHFPVLGWTHNPETQSFDDFRTAIQQRLDLMFQGRYVWDSESHPLVKLTYSSGAKCPIDLREENYRGVLATTWRQKRIFAEDDNIFVKARILVDDPYQVPEVLDDSEDDSEDVDAPEALDAPISMDFFVASADLLAFPKRYSNPEVEAIHQATQGQSIDLEGMVDCQEHLPNDPVQRSHIALSPTTEHFPLPRRRLFHPFRNTMIPQPSGFDNNQLTRIGGNRPAGNDDSGGYDDDDFSHPCASRGRVELPEE
ncbi:hypothetical protein F5H01DRAFT_323559 [Linnemannia elongata]|nr:hypothetical protein F5H01DRAFT_323559 [Linnemannia elongata]